MIFAKQTLDRIECEKFLLEKAVCKVLSRISIIAVASEGLSVFFGLFLFFNKFIYFCLRWVLVAASNFL